MKYPNIYEIICNFFCANSENWTHITRVFYFELTRYVEDVTLILSCDLPLRLQIIQYTVLYWQLVAVGGIRTHVDRLMRPGWNLSSLPRNIFLLGFWFFIRPSYYSPSYSGVVIETKENYLQYQNIKKIMKMMNIMIHY